MFRFPAYLMKFEFGTTNYLYDLVILVELIISTLGTFCTSIKLIVLVVGFWGGNRARELGAGSTTRIQWISWGLATAIPYPRLLATQIAKDGNKTNNITFVAIYVVNL